MSEFYLSHMNDPEQHLIGDEFRIGPSREFDEETDTQEQEELLSDILTEATEGEL